MARVYGASEDRAYGFYWALQAGAGQSYAESYWTTEGYWTPILSVANFGTATDNITIELTSNLGAFTLPAISLQALESRTLNIRDLIESGVTDRNGKAFPAGVDFGGYRVYGASEHSKLVIKEHLLNSALRLSTPFYGVYTYAVSLFFILSDATSWDPDTNAPYSVDVSGNTIGIFADLQMSDGSTPDACPTNWDVYSGSSNINFATNHCIGVLRRSGWQRLHRGR